jgi:hypothetical protein
MTNRQKRNSQLCLYIIVLAGIFSFIQISQAATLTHKDDSMVQDLFTHTKPQCVGRYLIDVPELFNNNLNDMIFIDDFRIESLKLYQPAFQQRIKLREQELFNSTTKPGNDPKDAPYLKEVIRQHDGKGVIFDHNEPGTPGSYRQLEAHIYTNMTAFIITTEIVDFSNPNYSRDRELYLKSGFTQAETNTKKARLSSMKSLISRLSGRKDVDIPTQSGLCIPNGFIKDEAIKHKEKVSFTYETDDFYFSIGTDNSYEGSKSTLLSRGAAIEDEQKQANFYTIKYGELRPGGIPSQEWLSAGMQESNHIKGRFPMYDFTLYANETIASPEKPWIEVGLSNTDKLTKYSKSQMVEIWDTLVSTLRYGPNAY